MKFRAKLVEPQNMKHLATIGHTLSKLCKICCLKICSNMLSFLIPDDNSSCKQIIIWCSISALQFFNEYHLEGLTESNEIYLELPSDMFSSSMNILKQSNNNVKSVKVKLTSKHTPCISVEMELLSEYSLTRTCLHDIPVRVIPPDEWSDYPEPPNFTYSMSLEINWLKKLRNVVDRVKKLSPYVDIMAMTDGSLIVSAKAQTATIKTIFKNNSIISNDGNNDEVSVNIDTKRLNQLLCTEQIIPRRSVCHFLKDKLLHFQLSQDHFVFHFFVLGIVE